MGLNNDYRFDLDLKYGQITENELLSCFNGDITIEVKTERDSWLYTGNIAIEYMSRGKKSGILKTESTYWFHVLKKSETIKMIFVFNSKMLFEWINDNHKKLTKVNGGDNNTSKLILIPIKRLHEISSYSK